MKDIESGLTRGLTTGYAGENKPKNVMRKGFLGKKSDVTIDAGYYHDEWFTGERTGGGQELLYVNGKKFTRLYAGGTPDTKLLDFLGVTEDEVSKYLKEKILELGDRTRLFENCTPKPDGLWQYKYKITGQDEHIGLTTGMETIDFSGSIVHAHAFILSPIK